MQGEELWIQSHQVLLYHRVLEAHWVCRRVLVQESHLKVRCSGVNVQGVVLMGRLKEQGHSLGTKGMCSSQGADAWRREIKRV